MRCLTGWGIGLWWFDVAGILPQGVIEIPVVMYGGAAVQESRLGHSTDREIHGGDYAHHPAILDNTLSGTDPADALTGRISYGGGYTRMDHAGVER